MPVFSRTIAIAAAVIALAASLLMPEGAAYAGLGQPTPWQIGLQDAASPARAAEGRDDDAPSVKNSAPVVVRSVPQAGDTQVDAAKTTEIRVTFSKEMADQSWSWSQISKESYPEITGKPHYDADKRTCILPVKLKPGKTYVIWLNPVKFQGFRDAEGNPSVFYPLVFETKK